jgi:hypothetical protein
VERIVTGVSFSAALALMLGAFFFGVLCCSVLSLLNAPRWMLILVAGLVACVMLLLGWL